MLHALICVQTTFQNTKHPLATNRLFCICRMGSARSVYDHDFTPLFNEAQERFNEGGTRRMAALEGGGAEATTLTDEEAQEVYVELDSIALTATA